MKKMILFGATGNLGKEIAKEAKPQGYDLTVVVRNQAKADQLSKITSQYVIVNITDPHVLSGICKGFDIVVSALGKSVSPNDHSKPTFHDIDLMANSYILKEAVQAGVLKFVYVSALHSERYPHLEYFRVHHQFSEKLKQSGLNYSIIKPPAIFSAYVDVMKLAKKGQLVTIGSGDKQTNPIYEGDLARICVQSIQQVNATIEAGGKKLYSRKQLNEMIQAAINSKKKVRSVPTGLFNLGLPLIRLVNKNMYDKFAFFNAVMQHDTIAPQTGETTFEEYLQQKAANVRGE